VIVQDLGQPEGLKESSRGLSASVRYPRTARLLLLTLKGSQNSGTPSGCEFYADFIPGVYASLRPPATLLQPCGLRTWWV